MKKTIGILFIIMILATSVTVFAAEPVITSEFDSDDYMLFIIEGQSDANTPVLAIIYNIGYDEHSFGIGNEKESILNLETTTADDNGSYKFIFNMESSDFSNLSGDYTVTVNYTENGERVSKSIGNNKFVSKSERDVIVQILSGLNKDESTKSDTIKTIEELFTAYGDKMMIDESLLQFYLSDDKITESINEAVFNNLEKLTSISAFKVFAEEQICLSKLNSADKDTIGQYITAYRYIIGLDNVTYIEKYSDLKSKIYERLASAEDVNTTEEFNEKIYEISAVVYIEDSSRWGELYSRIKEYKSDINVDMSDESTYSELEDTSDVFVSMLSEKPYESFKDIKDKFDDAVSACIENEEEDDDDDSNSSSKRRGGGGGGISWATDTKAETKPSNTTENFVPTVTDDKSVFPDVETDYWAYNALCNLKERNILSGDDAGNINPDNNITRAEFLKLVIESLNLNSAATECNFTDVSADTWYYDYVITGYALGIINGISSDAFGPQTPVSRQDMAVILHRALKKTDYRFDTRVYTSFTDNNKIDDYAKESVDALVGEKLINGFPDGTFRSDNLSTRAEAATMLWRAIQQ